MPDIELIAAITLLLAAVAAALVRPEASVMALGIFLFVQSAIIRVDDIPRDAQAVVARLDEVVLLALAVRTAVSLLLTRRLELPPPLLAMLALVAIGVVSTVMNGVPIVMGGVGLYLTVKGGLWLFVAMHLRYDGEVLARYGIVIGALFLIATALGAIQFIGVPLPWDPHMRRSGELAATSIWNQHTVFGSAMAVAFGLAVIAIRLPGWRWHAFVLGAAAAGGILLSTVRRLLVTIPAGIAVSIAALPASERERLAQFAARVLQPRVAIAIAISIAMLAAVAGPRTARVVADTWDEYVVHAEDRDRYVLYRGGVELALDSPLIGRGPGTYGSYASVVFDSPVYEELDIGLRDGLKMGAPYASLLGELGVLGLGAFLAFVGLTARELLPVARASGSPLSRALATGGLFMLTDMTIQSVVHVTFSDSFVAFFAFMAIGAALAVDRHTESRDEVAASPAPPGPRFVVGSVALATALILAEIGIVSWLSPSTAITDDQRPNIVLIVATDVDVNTFAALDGRQADGSSLPSIADVLGTSGVTFENAVTSNSDDCPARVSMLVGQHAHNHGVSDTDGQDCHAALQQRGLEDRMIGAWLQSSGYRTAYVGTYIPGYGRDDFSLRYSPPPSGWDDWKAIWGTPAYWNYRLNEDGDITGRGQSDEFYLTHVLTRASTALISENDPRPLFLVVAPLAAGEPPVPPNGTPSAGMPQAARGDEGLYRDAPLSLDLVDSHGKPPFVQDIVSRRRSNETLDSELKQEAQEQHAARLSSLAAVESMLRQVVTALESEGELDNTYIIFTSDNGFHVGQHGLLPGGTSTPYEPDIRVPLVVRGPGIAGGSVIDELVSTLDLPATIADLAAVEPPLVQDGHSLLPLLTGTADSGRTHVLLEHWESGRGPVPSYVGVRTPTLKYVEWADGFREFYDLAEDPYELTNAYSARDPAVEAARRTLERLVKCVGTECWTSVP